MKAVVVVVVACAMVALMSAGTLEGEARAADNNECMSAASKGQEVRDQGHLLEARALFQQCAQSSCPNPIPKYCGEWLAEVNRKMPTVVVRAVDGETNRDITDATMSIDDGAPIAVDGRALDVDPGKHRLRVTSGGGGGGGGQRPYETEIVVAQSEKDRVVVAKMSSSKASSPPSSPSVATASSSSSMPEKRSGVPLVSWIGWGIGAVGLISFTAFGLKARSDYDDFESRCGTRCTIADRDSVSTSVTIADISLVVGLVAAGVGTLFYVLRPSTTPKAAAR